jgi:hypothetical protein
LLGRTSPFFGMLRTNDILRLDVNTAGALTGLGGLIFLNGCRVRRYGG